MTGAAPAFAEALSAGLTTQRFGRAFRHLERCGSTNDEAARWSQVGAPEGAAVVADEQRSGRGRLGRVWHSPPGASLYLSLLLRPELPVSALPPLTLLTGAVVAEALGAWDVPCRLKWPNDIMLPADAGLRKAGGILVETATTQGRIRHVIVGIGVNVASQSFPQELEAIATSLGNVVQRPPSRCDLLCTLLNVFEPAYDRFVREGAPFALSSWRRYGWLGQRCRVERDGSALEGTAVDVDDSGALVLQDEAGKRHVVLSGEVVTKL